MDILGIVLFLMIISLVTYRIIFHKFKKYNNENIGLIISTFILLQLIDIDGLLYDILKILSLLMGIFYISMMVITREKNKE